MLLCVSLIPESSVMTSFVSPVGVTPGVTASKEISASPTSSATDLWPLDPTTDGADDVSQGNLLRNAQAFQHPIA